MNIAFRQIIQITSLVNSYLTIWEKFPTTYYNFQPRGNKLVLAYVCIIRKCVIRELFEIKANITATVSLRVVE